MGAPFWMCFECDHKQKLLASTSEHGVKCEKCGGSCQRIGGRLDKGIRDAVKSRDPLLFAAVVDALRFQRGMKYNEVLRAFKTIGGVSPELFDVLCRKADDATSAEGRGY